MKNKRKNYAISEIVSVALLLSISISLFAVIQFVVLSYPFDPSPPSLNLVGSINKENILIEHQGGERISLNSKIILLIEGKNQASIIARDYLDDNSSDDDNYWEIGEILSYDTGMELTGIRVEATVVDKETNSIVMTGIIQGGSS
jgi:hypothetical protein